MHTRHFSCLTGKLHFFHLCLSFHSLDVFHNIENFPLSAQRFRSLDFYIQQVLLAQSTPNSACSRIDRQTASTLNHQQNNRLMHCALIEFVQLIFQLHILHNIYPSRVLKNPPVAMMRSTKAAASSNIITA